MRTVTASGLGVTERKLPPAPVPVKVTVASISVFFGKFLVVGG